MTTMRAVRFHTNGGPEVLTLDEVPVPEPGPGEVLIRVAAAGVNYADLLQRQGGYPVPGSLPVTPGFEVAGTVAALGPGVAGPPVGARVVAGVQGGGYAEYVAAPAATALPIPDGLGFDEATALIVQGLTAYGVLHTAGRLQPGETALVTAAAGGVGSIAVQLAKAAGARVVAAAGSASKLELARELGADVAVDYSRAGWDDEVRAATGGRGIDLAVESVGGDVGRAALGLLAAGGRMVVYGSASGQPIQLVSSELVGRGLTVAGFTLYGRMAPEHLAEGMRALLGAHAAGRLRLTVGFRAPLAEAAEAHRVMAARQTTGKVVLTVG